MLPQPVNQGIQDWWRRNPNGLVRDRFDEKSDACLSVQFIQFLFGGRINSIRHFDPNVGPFKLKLLEYLQSLGSLGDGVRSQHFGLSGLEWIELATHFCQGMSL